MPRTLPQPDPPRLRQFPAICRCWCDRWVSTLVDTVDPRHAWMLFDQLSKYSNSNSNSMEIHPRMAWIHQIAEICQRWGGMGRQDRWRHGCRHRAPMDGFTACPACPCRPTIPRNASCCCCSGRGFGRCRAQPCRKTHIKKTAGRGLLFRCNGAPGEIRTPDRLVRSQVLYPTELRARGTQSIYYLILLHFQRRMLETCRVVRPERFELPTAWFVARYSIQLSYGRPATGAELCGCRRAPSTVL